MRKLICLIIMMMAFNSAFSQRFCIFFSDDAYKNVKGEIDSAVIHQVRHLMLSEWKSRTSNEEIAEAVILYDIQSNQGVYYQLCIVCAMAAVYSIINPDSCLLAMNTYDSFGHQVYSRILASDRRSQLFSSQSVKKIMWDDESDENFTLVAYNTKLGEFEESKHKW